MLDYKVTNQKKFNESQIETVDLEGLYKMDFQGISYEGNLRLHLKDGTDQNITGDFSPKDFEREFGFKIIGDND